MGVRPGQAKGPSTSLGGSSGGGALVPGNFATPSALVGLTAIPGSAITATRSDGAPALNQAIVPTWTGVHTFTQPIVSGASGGFSASSIPPFCSGTLSYYAAPSFISTDWTSQVGTVDFTDPNYISILGNNGTPWYTRKTVTLDGLQGTFNYTVKDGAGTTSAGLYYGGGIFINSGAPTVPGSNYAGVLFYTTQFESGPRFKILDSVGTTLYTSAILDATKTYSAKVTFAVTAVSVGTQYDLTITLTVGSLGISQSFTITNWVPHATTTVGSVNFVNPASSNISSKVQMTSMFLLGVGFGGSCAVGQTGSLIKPSGTVAQVGDTTWGGTNYVTDPNSSHTFKAGTVTIASINSQGVFNSAALAGTGVRLLTASATGDIGANATTIASAQAWTGLQTFTGGMTVATSFTSSVAMTCTFSGNGGILVSAAVPTHAWNETGAAANNRYWDIVAFSEQLSFRVVNDALNTVASWMVVDRTGTTVDSVTFPKAAIFQTTIAVTGVATFTAAPIFSSTTASQVLVVDASKNLASLPFTGTVGSVVMAASPTFTGTVAMAALTLSGLLRFNGTNSTGAGSALLGTNCPAVTATAPYTWISALSSDGSTVFIPVWK